MESFEDFSIIYFSWMGAQCSGDADNFDGTNLFGNITPETEIFTMGQLPQVNQTPRRFDDDDPIDVQRQTSRQMPNQLEVLQQSDYDLNKNLRLLVKSQGISNDKQNLALMVSVETKEVELESVSGKRLNRPGIDLICVIDHSGSMQGEKIKLVKRTLKHMLEFLGPQDRLCLIQFDCKCYRLTRLMRVNQKNMDKFRIAIHALQARGGTNIENGMHMAFSVLKHRRYINSVSAIFLLSDGVDEGGEERVRDSLRRAMIRDPFTIKTFGFGRDVCPRLMSEIAHYKEGQFYFLPDLSKIDECFVEALGGLVSVIGNNMKLSVKPVNAGNTRITKAYGDKWQYDSSSRMHFLYQPHLLSGVTKDFVFEMGIPKNQPQIFVEVKLEIEPVNGKKLLIFQETVQVNQDIPDDGEVRANYMRVKGAEVLQNALQIAEAGNLSSGRQMVENALAQMQQQGIDPNDPQTMMLYNDLLLARQRMTNQTDFNTDGRHHLMQLHIVHMYQKSRGVQIAAQGGVPNSANLDCAYQNNIQKAYKEQTRQMKQDPNYFQ